MKSVLIERDKLNDDVKLMSDNIREFKELEKLRMQFFANLSHEFKTPINIIFSCIQLLSKEKKANVHSFLKHYEKYDSTMTQNCYRMIRLINNLVDITKIDSGFLKLDFSNHDIVSLVEDITLSVVPYVESKQLTITFDTPVEELEIRCDSDSIERVILNLLSNSIKFTKEGGNIFVSVDVDDTWVSIKVIDDGIGIPDEIKSSVFNAFVQGDKSLTRKKEGSGIGLSLVKSIVDLHGGQVKINHSSGSSGTEIEIQIPKITTPKNEADLSNKKSSINNIAEKINIEFSDIYDF